MYTIGGFSKITGLTVKTLRFYHERGLLVPSCVDDQTGYRYYDSGNAEAARIITELRKLDFSLEEIAEILRGYDDEDDILEFLERQRDEIADKLRLYRTVQSSLDQIITSQREARVAMQTATFQVEEKLLDPMLIAGIRMKGKYSDCGKAFAQIGKRFGRHVCGKCLLLHYDTEYKEDDADFEACMPVRKRLDVEGISVRELPGGRCVSLMHKGPYEQLGRSYAKIIEHCEAQGLRIETPTREVYVKGPGMIFRGNPKRYLTEIQMPLVNGTNQ